MKKLSILLLILILALAACGGDGDDDADADTSDAQNTEQTSEELPADEDAEDEVEATEDDDAGDEEELPADEEAPDEEAPDEEATDEDAEATEEATTDEDTADDAGDEDAEDTTDESDAGDSEPVVVSGFESYEADCPSRFDIQFPPNWELLSAAGGNLRFNIDSNGVTTTANFEYRGAVASNQVGATYERFADLETTEEVGSISADGESFPIYRDDRVINGAPQARYYLFMLPGNLLVDNLRLTVNPAEDGSYPDEDEVIQMLSTVVSNRCS